MGLLTRAAREQGSTVILVTHEPRVAAYADREVIVRDGLGDLDRAGPSMIRLGLRLTLGSGREAALRVLVIAAAVALGVGLLLIALAGMNGLNAQTDRGAWLDTSAQTRPSTSGGSTSPAVVAAHRRPVRQPGDRPRGRRRHRTEAHRSRRGSRTCPDRASSTPRRPSRTCSASVPADELGDRFPGRQIGTIGAAALPSPNSLIIVIGREAHQLSQVPGAAEVRGIQQTLSQLLQLSERRRQRTGPAVDPGRWSCRPVAARAHPDRDRQPAVCRQARGALRRYAPRRRHAASDLGDLGGGGDGRGRCWSRGRFRHVLLVPAAAHSRPLRRSAIRPGRSVAPMESTSCSS